MFERIVVGWDESPSAAAAASWAAARAGSAPVRLVNVVPGHETGTDYLSATSPEAQARVRLMEAADDLRRRFPGANISTEVERGALIPELLRLSPEGTLLAVGGVPAAARHGAFGWSVGSRLAASSEPGVIAVIPPTSDAGRKGVVVGYDGAVESTAVLDFSISEATALREELRIVHAWTKPFSWQDAYAPGLDFVESLEDLHRDLLATAVHKATAEHGLTAGGLLMDATPARALVEAAQLAKELVVGNHATHDVRRFFLGSVSHAVVRELVAPTLVVRS